MNVLRAFLRLLPVLMLMTACGGLGGEPEVVATLPPSLPQSAPPQDKPTVQISDTVDLALGAQVFAENCTRCHGVQGKGDGEFVLTGQIASLGDFTNPAMTASASPSQWFEIVTNGRLSTLMPPWGESLNESERWAVTMYLYTLAYTPEQIASGKAVYTAECAVCHGESGRGDGDGAVAMQLIPADLALPSTLADLSDTALLDVISSGAGERMPGFADKLTAAQRQDAAIYTRLLSLSNRPIEQPDSPPQVAQVSGSDTSINAGFMGTIGGNVILGTGDGSLPSDLKVILHTIDADYNEQTQDVSLNSDGSFIVPEVLIESNKRYFVTVYYGNGFFISDVVNGDPSNPLIDLPVTIYDVTSDPSVVQMTRSLSQVYAASDGLEVMQILTFDNTSDRIFMTGEAVSEFRQVSISIELPEGARFVNTDDTGRYRLSSDGKRVLDTQPIFPDDTHIVHVLYKLPLNDRVRVELPLDYALNGSVEVILPESLKFESTQLTQQQSQIFGGDTYQTYQGNLVLAPGDRLNYEISGIAGSAPNGLSSNILLGAVLLGVGIGAIAAAAILYVRGRQRQPIPDSALSPNDLVRQIAELDQLHEQGQLGEAAYENQRRSLKAQLTQLLKEQQRG